LLYIVVRRTTDWKNEAVFRAQLPPGFAALVELWNDTFDMPFHIFRDELKQIAALNHAHVEGAVTTSLEAVPDGALIAPTDDDDWFSPALAKVLHDDTVDRYQAYRWPSSFLEVPINLGHRLGLLRRQLFPATPPRWICTTNNYAITNRAGVGAVLASHIRASEWFGANEAAVKKLDVPLSLQNRNLASQTSLLFRRGRMTQAALLRKYRKYTALYSSPRMPQLEWCRPYAARMAELMEALRLRRG
jgi:hypothetical protein